MVVLRKIDKIMYTKTRIMYGPYASSFADIYYPELKNENNSTLVSLYHGGYYKKEHDLYLMEPLAEDLVNEGYTVANVEYVRVGEGSNNFTMITNVLASFAEIASKVPHEKTAVIGHSAGGYYALMIMMGKQLPHAFMVENAITPNVVIAQAPLTDLWRGQKERLSDDGDAIEKFIDDTPAENIVKHHYDKISPISYAVPEESQLLIVHGFKDIDVPYAHSESFHHSRKGAVSLLQTGQFDHYDVINPNHEIWKAQKAFLADCTS